MDYRKATFADVSQIKLLWEEVFGDAEDYAIHFITHFGVEHCYVCETNHKIVAIAFALPTALTSPSNFKRVPEGRGSLYENKTTESETQPNEGRGSLYENLSLKYLYACATHPTHQKQGIMQKLLSTIYDKACRENVAGVFLNAADPDLANYYRKLGFEDFFYRNHSWYYKFKLFEKEPVPSNTITFISPETYHQKRIEKLKGTCFVNWNEDFFRFIHAEKIQLCEYENTIFSYKTGLNQIIVDEFLGDMPNEQLARLLMEHLPDFETVHIRSQGNEHCCGQIKWCTSWENQPKSGYFAFVME